MKVIVSSICFQGCCLIRKQVIIGWMYSKKKKKTIVVVNKKVRKRKRLNYTHSVQKKTKNFIIIVFVSFFSLPPQPYPYNYLGNPHHHYARDFGRFELWQIMPHSGKRSFSLSFFTHFSPSFFPFYLFFFFLHATDGCQWWGWILLKHDEWLGEDGVKGSRKRNALFLFSFSPLAPIPLPATPIFRFSTQPGKIHAWIFSRPVVSTNVRC